MPAIDLSCVLDQREKTDTKGAIQMAGSDRTIVQRMQQRTIRKTHVKEVLTREESLSCSSSAKMDDIDTSTPASSGSSGDFIKRHTDNALFKGKKYCITGRVLNCLLYYIFQPWG